MPRPSGVNSLSDLASLKAKVEAAEAKFAQQKLDIAGAMVVDLLTNGRDTHKPLVDMLEAELSKRVRKSSERQLFGLSPLPASEKSGKGKAKDDKKTG